MALRLEFVGADSVGMFGFVVKELEGSARRNMRDAKTSQRGEQVMVESFGSPIAVVNRGPENEYQYSEMVLLAEKIWNG